MADLPSDDSDESPPRPVSKNPMQRRDPLSYLASQAAQAAPLYPRKSTSPFPNPHAAVFNPQQQPFAAQGSEPGLANFQAPVFPPRPYPPAQGHYGGAFHRAQPLANETEPELLDPYDGEVHDIQQRFAQQQIQQPHAAAVHDPMQQPYYAHPSQGLQHYQRARHHEYHQAPQQPCIKMHPTHGMKRRTL